MDKINTVKNTLPNGWQIAATVGKVFDEKDGSISSSLPTWLRGEHDKILNEIWTSTKTTSNPAMVYALFGCGSSLGMTLSDSDTLLYLHPVITVQNRN